MCVIFSCEDRHITFDELIDGQTANGDGGGMAWIKDGTVHWKKGLTAGEILTLIAEQEVTFPYVIHFRIGTVGGTTDALTHPFPINDLASLELEGTCPDGVLFHNGHWSEWRNMILRSVTAGNRRIDGLDDWSDSRAMAYLVRHHGTGILDFIEHQKMALLTPERVVRWGSWEDAETKGVKASNKHYVVKPMTYVGAAAGGWRGGAPDGYYWKKDPKAYHQPGATTTTPVGAVSQGSSISGTRKKKRFELMDKLKIVYNNFSIADKESQNIYDRRMESTEYTVADAKRIGAEVLFGEAEKLDITDMADIEAWITVRLPELTLVGEADLAEESTVIGSGYGLTTSDENDVRP